MNLFGGTPKYRGLTTDPIDGTPLSWSAHPEGLPVRAGDSPGLVNAEQAKHATSTLFARSEVLRIPDQLERYNAILDWVLNTTGQPPVERVQDLGDGKWVVWVIWADLRGFIPKQPFPALVGKD